MDNYKLEPVINHEINQSDVIILSFIWNKFYLNKLYFCRINFYQKVKFLIIFLGIPNSKMGIPNSADQNFVRVFDFA